MYCPTCFNKTLSISSRGLINIIINNKQMDAGRVLYNTETDEENELDEKIEKKIKDFFVWYSNFLNKEDITKVELNSSDFVCSKCSKKHGARHSIIDILISRKRVLELLGFYGIRYNFFIDLED